MTRRMMHEQIASRFSLSLQVVGPIVFSLCPCQVVWEKGTLFTIVAPAPCAPCGLRELHCMVEWSVLDGSSIGLLWAIRALLRVSLVALVYPPLCARLYCLLGWHLVSSRR